MSLSSVRNFFSTSPRNSTSASPPSSDFLLSGHPQRRGRSNSSHDYNYCRTERRAQFQSSSNDTLPSTLISNRRSRTNSPTHGGNNPPVNGAPSQDRTTSAVNLLAHNTDDSRAQASLPRIIVESSSTTGLGVCSLPSVPIVTTLPNSSTSSLGSCSLVSSPQTSPRTPSEIILELTDFQQIMKIWKSLTKLRGGAYLGLYTKDDFIPNKKVIAARKACSLKLDDEIYFLYDKTLTGTGESCTVFTQRGIHSSEGLKKYFYNDSPVKFTTWKQLGLGGLLCREEDLLYLDQDYILNGFTNSKRLFYLLKCVRVYMSETYPYSVTLMNSTIWRGEARPLLPHMTDNTLQIQLPQRAEDKIRLEDHEFQTILANLSSHCRDGNKKKKPIILNREQMKRKFGKGSWVSSLQFSSFLVDAENTAFIPFTKSLNIFFISNSGLYLRNYHQERILGMKEFVMSKSLAKIRECIILDGEFLSLFSSTLFTTLRMIYVTLRQKYFSFSEPPAYDDVMFALQKMSIPSTDGMTPKEVNDTVQEEEEPDHDWLSRTNSPQHGEWAGREDEGELVQFLSCPNLRDFSSFAPPYSSSFSPSPISSSLIPPLPVSPYSLSPNPSPAVSPSISRLSPSPVEDIDLSHLMTTQALGRTITS